MPRFDPLHTSRPTLLRAPADRAAGDGARPAYRSPEGTWYRKRLDLLRQLDASLWQELRAAAQAHDFQRRELLFSPVDRGDAVYLVESGRVRLSRFREDATELVLAVIEAGEIFGEGPRAADRLREGVAEALDDGRVLRFDRPVFEGLVRAHPALARRLDRTPFG